MLSFSLSIFLESSKCDQFRNQAWIIIARTDLPTCPFKALEDDISEAQISLSEDLLCSWPLLLPVRTTQRCRSAAAVHFYGCTALKRL